MSLPITVASRPNAEIMGTNPTYGIDVRVRLFCVRAVLCADSGFATGWSPSKESTGCVKDIFLLLFMLLPLWA
jgi:hypothetical protein